MSGRRSSSWAIALVLGTIGTVHAAEVVPYSGFLDRDGVPVDGAARLRFRVYADEGAPAAPAQIRATARASRSASGPRTTRRWPCTPARSR